MCFILVFFLLSRLRCTQMQQRNQKREDCGMQICQHAVQLVYCYKWNTSNLVRKRKYQVLKEQPYSFQNSIPDRFFPLQKVYLFSLPYRPIKLEGISKSLSHISPPFNLLHELKRVHGEGSFLSICLCSHYTNWKLFRSFTLAFLPPACAYLVSVYAICRAHAVF